MVAATPRDQTDADTGIAGGRNSITPGAPVPIRSIAAAITYIARFHGLAPAIEDCLHGLPSGPQAPLAYLEEIAARAGLEIRVQSKSPTSVSELTLPVLGITRDGKIGVVEAVDRAADTVSICLFDADGSGADTTLTWNEAAAQFEGVSIQTMARARAAVAAETPANVRARPFGGHWFWSAAARAWPNYLQVVIAAFLINVLGLALPLFVMNVYDRVIPNLAIPTLWALAAGVAIAMVFDLVLKVLRARIVDETGRRVDMAVSGRVFDHILALRLAARPPSGGALASRIRELDTVRDAMTSSSVIALTDFVFIGVFLWVMWLVVGPLVLVPTAAVPAVIVVTLLVQVPLSRAFKRAQSDIARRHGILAETIDGLEALKTIGGEGTMRHRWDHAVAASSRSTADARFWAMIATTFVGLTQQIVSVAIIVWGVFLVLEGTITVGALIAANILSGRVLAPLAGIAQTLARVIQARTALADLNGVMALAEERTAGGADIADGSVSGEVVLDTVSFTYPRADRKALDTVSVRIAPGERIGVVGRVGSGKSTLGRLIAGLYEPDEGAVLVDGRDIRQTGPARLRQTVGYAQQDPELFSGTLRDNIVMGAPFTSEDDIALAVRLSGVERFAAQHPAGLELPVEERGRSLSGGQRQAVSLARLLVRNPSVLYLDEPSAALDMVSEVQLISHLREVAETGVTLIISTHRERMLDLVDRLIVMEAGRVVGDGPREEIKQALRDRAARGRLEAGNDAQG